MTEPHTQPTLEHFGVAEHAVRQVLTAALEKGGDFADLFFEHTQTHSLSLRDGAVNATYAGIHYGVGIRVLAGNQTGYAYVESTGLPDMLKAARTAARIAASGAPGMPANLAWKETAARRYPVLQPWDAVTVHQRIPFVQRLNDALFALDPRVDKVMVSLSDSTSKVVYANSQGLVCSDSRPMMALSVTCILTENGVYENGRAARSYRAGFERLTESLVDDLAREAVADAAVMFKAVKPKGGEMPVVLGAGGSGIFLHEAIGHAFEADFNRKGVSIFSDKLGKSVAAPFVNVVDDGTIPHNRGSINLDDEGVEGQKTYLVKEGILHSYLHDRISAAHYGVAPTGNGRRESFRSAPLPRMRATYMEGGTASEADLIASVKHGVFVNNFTNGEVQIGAGDFTFFVKSGFLIENGVLTTPIRDINIIGNGPKALADIVQVADNPKMDDGTWTCGKDGQSCPVTCGMPSALIGSLTVGGLH